MLDVVATHDGSVPEAELVERLRDGDEAAFRQLVRCHLPGLRRVARLYVPDAVVDEVVQETWMGVIAGIDRFEGRASVKTWIYRILLNQARRHGARERRTVPFSSRGGPGTGGPSVDPEHLVHPELGRGYWPDRPPDWHADPERLLLDSEVRATVLAAIRTLPDAQREVITLRDVEGWTSAEACEALGISAVNQRVLLHRARVHVRDALEEYVDGS